MHTNRNVKWNREHEGTNKPKKQRLSRYTLWTQTTRWLTSIQPPILPTPTLLTFTCTQVLWFLARLTRPRASGVNTRPDPRFVIISTRSTQCLRGVQIPPFSRLVSHYTDTHLYVFSVTLVLPHIIIRTENETKKLWFTGKSVKIKKWKYIRCQLVRESWGNKTREGVKRGGIRREQKKRGRGIKST